MEATKLTFFKKTKDSMNSNLSPKERGKLRLERIYKLCPESGATLQEIMKYAGYDPGIPKQYQAGAAFIKYHRKVGNLIDIPIKEYINGSRKNRTCLIAPNYGKVKVTVKPKVEVKKEEPKIEEKKIEVKKSTVITNISISIEKGNDLYKITFEDINSDVLKERFSKIIESLE
jgi:hypothetical protein